MNKWLPWVGLAVVSIGIYVLYQGLIVIPQREADTQRAIKLNQSYMLQACLSSAENAYTETMKLPGASEPQNAELISQQTQQAREDCYKLYPQN